MLKGMSGTEDIKNDELVALDVDILIPAAYEHTIHKNNSPSIKAPVIVEAANAGISREAYNILHDRGKFVLPDILVKCRWYRVILL